VENEDISILVGPTAKKDYGLNIGPKYYNFVKDASNLMGLSENDILKYAIITYIKECIKHYDNEELVKEIEAFNLISIGKASRYPYLEGCIVEGSIKYQKNAVCVFFNEFEIGQITNAKNISGKSVKELLLSCSEREIDHDNWVKRGIINREYDRIATHECWVKFHDNYDENSLFIFKNINKQKIGEFVYRYGVNEACIYKSLKDGAVECGVTEIESRHLSVGLCRKLSDEYNSKQMRKNEK